MGSRTLVRQSAPGAAPALTLADPIYVYGSPPAELAPVPVGAVQLSPLSPGAEAIEGAADGSAMSVTVLAPPGTAERRFALAHALRILRADGELVVLAQKDRGGSRLGAELAAFGCAVDEAGRRHHRICHIRRPAAPTGLDTAIAEGAPRLDPRLRLWTQPGVFSWDRIDPGSRLLIDTLPKTLSGEGADLGCGLGIVAQAVLASPKVKALHLIDIDRRAVDCARHNVDDPRAAFHWADVRKAEAVPSGLDFVAMNPPFHADGAESKALGQDFIRAAHTALRRSGALWLVANRHLPYETLLRELFTDVQVRADTQGFKVLEARK